MTGFMSRWPFVIVAVLILLPIMLMAGVGGWALWTTGHLRWLAWTITICWSVAWLVLRYAGHIEVPLPKIGSEIHWTPRDHAAMAIVEEEQKRIPELTGEQLIDPQFYGDKAKELATRFAQHYHPSAKDPLGSVSVIELLTAVQLVAEDMEQLLQENVPGSHLLTVSQWRSLAKAPEWWRTASNIGWIASMLWNPSTLARYAVSKAFVDPASKQIQTNILAAIYLMFLRQLGYYLIELNSGRLRGGSARYRAAMRHLEPGKVATQVSRQFTRLDLPALIWPMTAIVITIGS